MDSKLMDLKKLAAAIALQATSHSAGHIKAGEKSHFTMSIDRKTLNEVWDERGKKMPADVKEYVHASGFAGQEKTKGAMGPEGYAANALYKAAYMAGGGKMLSGFDDFDYVGKQGGENDKRNMKTIMGLSIIADAIKATGRMKNHDISFGVDQKTGTPMLIFSGRFK